jgi:cell wall-associated NlpC family hydrolase
MAEMDPRLNAYRTDLADIRLLGKVQASRFVEGEPMQVTVAVADMRRSARPDSGVDTQLVFGEKLDIFEEREGWCWAQSHRDGYVGYVADTALSRRTSEPTHIVVAPRTFLYPGPDMKLPAEAALSMGSRLSVTGKADTRGTHYLKLETGGAVIADHVTQLGVHAPDPVAIAETLLNTPYLWGGCSGHGIDCSGLIQLAYAMCGRTLQRDTSMQQISAGEEIFPGQNGEELRRGDLVFWRGHVAMMHDTTSIIHASGHSMTVTVEDYEAAIHRIAHLYGEPIAYRRIF